MAKIRRPEESKSKDTTEAPSLASLDTYGLEFIGDEEITDDVTISPSVLSVGDQSDVLRETLTSAAVAMAGTTEPVVYTSSLIAEDSMLPKPGDMTIAVVLADPQGKMYMLHRTKDGRMRFPSKTAAISRTDAAGVEKAANDVLFEYAGISVPHWEIFAYDEGTNTVYVRAYHRNIFDASMVCPNGEGSVHVNVLENILGGVINGANKHVQWIAAVAAYAPLMSHLTFKCPVE